MQLASRSVSPIRSSHAFKRIAPVIRKYSIRETEGQSLMLRRGSVA
jgi:hypothetical protein